MKSLSERSNDNKAESLLSKCHFEALRCLRNTATPCPTIHTRVDKKMKPSGLACPTKYGVSVCLSVCLCGLPAL